MHKIKYFKHVTTVQKIVVISGTFVACFGGIVLSVIAISEIRNYKSPKYFALIFGFIGLAIALIISKKIKKHVVLTKVMEQNYSQLVLYFSVGFIGMSLFTAQIINGLTNQKKCSSQLVQQKIYRKGGYKRTAKNVFEFRMDGEDYQIHTSLRYWDSVNARQSIDLCVHQGMLGFDYFTLPNESR